MDNFGHGFPDEFIRPFARSFVMLKRSNVDFFQDKNAFGFVGIHHEFFFR